MKASDLKEQTNRVLYSFAQRQLKGGELLLLSKAISDRIMLPPNGTVNIRLYTLTQREYIMAAVFAVKEWAYITSKDIEVILQSVDDFLGWRCAVAYRPGDVIFTGDARIVVDELSQMTRYIDMSKLCEISDMVLDANLMYSVFADVCGCIQKTGDGNGA